MKIVFQLFFTFFKIGAFTLGGGYAMLSMVEKAVVDKKQWIPSDEFWDMIAIVQSLPGVFAVNTALYVGHRIAGRKGAAAAMLGAIIPSIVIILLLATIFREYRDLPVVERIFKGIRPCVHRAIGHAQLADGIGVPVGLDPEAAGLLGAVLQKRLSGHLQSRLPSKGIQRRIYIQNQGILRVQVKIAFLHLPYAVFRRGSRIIAFVRRQLAGLHCGCGHDLMLPMSILTVHVVGEYHQGTLLPKEPDQGQRDGVG